MNQRASIQRSKTPVDFYNLWASVLWMTCDMVHLAWDPSLSYPLFRHYHTMGCISAVGLAGTSPGARASFSIGVNHCLFPYRHTKHQTDFGAAFFDPPSSVLHPAGDATPLLFSGRRTSPDPWNDSHRRLRHQLIWTVCRFYAPKAWSSIYSLLASALTC